MMRVSIAGVGAWGPGFRNRDELIRLLNNEAPAIEGFQTPKPETIPPRERRRAPLAVKLAVEVAGQACTAAGREPADAICVFASGMGDMDITDYMCRTVVSEDPLVSPTKFHNSVHNAPVGYWSIATGCTQSGNAVAGFEDTVPASLLEAITQCHVETMPVLWVSQDIASPTPFADIHAITEACAFALLLEPGASGNGTAVNVQVGDQPGQWPVLPPNPLSGLYDSNPSARALALLGVLEGSTVALPLSPRRSLEIAPA